MKSKLKELESNLDFEQKSANDNHLSPNSKEVAKMQEIIKKVIALIPEIVNLEI